MTLLYGGIFWGWYPYSDKNNSQKWYLETANYRLGDVDMDGTITANDATLLQSYIAHLSPLNNIQLYFSDISGDLFIRIA